jgi:hypothetical protein
MVKAKTGAARNSARRPTVVAAFTWLFGFYIQSKRAGELLGKWINPSLLIPANVNQADLSVMEAP